MHLLFRQRRGFQGSVRHLSRGLSQKRALKDVKQLESFSVAAFRNEVFVSQVPAFLGENQLHPIRAATRWVTPRSNGYIELNAHYLTANGSEDPVIPLEYTKSTDGLVKFQQIAAPLSFFTTWTNEKISTKRNDNIYLAQLPLSELPVRLQQDLPAPELVKTAGKGDVYGSSIWMGLAPTYTPLHKDPNPNLLVQLAGEKVIRLFEPDVGSEICTEVQQLCGQPSSLQLRGTEMMEGEQAKLFESMVWEDEPAPGKSLNAAFEVRIRPGQGVFIPLGWWHSVRGYGNGVTASVNWWFR